MNQKVIYSMMGLAALPVAQAVAQTSYSWSGTTLTIGEGLVVADATAAETQSINIGKLVPGSYNLAVNVTSKVYGLTVEVKNAKAEAKQSVNNSTAAQPVSINFDVEDATKDIIITFASSEPGETGSGYSYEAPVVSLVYDFNAAKTTLETRANALKTTNIAAYTYDSTDDETAVDNLVAAIYAIDEKYLTYKDKKLYNLDSKKTTIDDEIADLAATIADHQNTQAYNDVNAKITAIKTKYNAAVAELEAALINQAAYLLDDAKADLNENINLKITEATSASYASYQAGTAVADETTNTALVPVEGDEVSPADGTLNYYVKKWKDQGTANQTAYNTLHGKVTDLQTALAAVTYADNDAAITAAFATERAAAQSAIDAINTKVEDAKNSAAQLTLDVTTDYDAANTKITTLAGKVTTANAEYNANKATVAAIATLQTNLDNAKTAVNAKVSADGNYKAADYYEAYVQAVQTEITGFSSAAAAAYKADGTGTAVTYNTGFSATATQNKIDDYKTNAVNAVTKYDDLQTAIASYTTDINAVRDAVEGLAIYTDETYDYKTKLDLIQKRINDIKKAITTAQEKVGADHWTAMLAIDADAAITTDIANLNNSYQADQNHFDQDGLTTGMTTLSTKITAFNAKVTDDTVVGDDYAVFAAAESGINTALSAVETAKGLVAVDYSSVNLTGEVGTTANDWVQGAVAHGGAAARTTTKNGITFVEQRTSSANANTGTLVTQTVNGLPNGTYTVELYAFAAGTPDDATDKVSVYANGKKTPVVVNASTYEYTINDVTVSNGTLTLSINKEAGNSTTNWHGIQIKSLIGQGDAANNYIRNLGTQVTAIAAQQTALEGAASEVEAKVTANNTSKSTLTTNIDNLQAAMTTFSTTYKIGADDSTLGNRGKAGGSVTTEVDAINTELAALETANNAVDVTAVADVDKTSAVGTEKSQWHSDMTNNGGNQLTVNNMAVYEQWSNNTAVINQTGSVISQTVNNLPNGVYDITVYAFALQGSATAGSTTNVHVYANGKTTPVTVSPKKSDGNWPGDASSLVAAGGFKEYTISDVLVSDGTLTLGLAKDQGGTQWHGIRIKSVNYHENTRATLAENTTTYNALAARKSTLDTNALTIKGEVEANAATYTAATTAVTALQTTELNTLKNLENVTNATAVSDDATAKKTDPADFKVFETGLAADKTYTARKAAIDGDIAALQTALVAANAAETMVADWKDNSITVGTGDAAKTYSIATITAAINQLKADAEAENDNYKAYKALQDNYMAKLLPDTIFTNKSGDVLVALTDAEIEAKVGAGAKTYYQGLQTTYTANKADILTRMQTSLTQRKAVAQKSAFETEINALIAQVAAVETDGVANYKKYQEQKSGDYGYEKTQTLWNSVYTEIAATDHSTKVQDYLDELDAIQVDLTAATTAVNTNYPLGKSVAEAQDFAAIQVRINSVKSRQAESYSEWIAVDNKAAHESFIGNETTKGAIQLATEAYQNAVQDRAKYSSTNADIKAAVDAAAATLDAALYSCPDEIQTLTANENAAYVANSELADPTPFDVSSYNTQATTIQNNITTALNNFTTAVQTALQGYWDGKTTGYNTKVTTAENDITTYSDAAKTDAFKDVKDLIADGQAAVTAMNLTEVEAKVAALENIDDLLAADKDVAADKDLTPLFTQVETKYTEVKNYINGVSNDIAAKATNLASLEAAYDDGDATTHTDVAYAKTLAKTFANRGTIKGILDAFLTNADGYKTAVETAVTNDNNNTAAYNEMTAALSPVETKLANAKELAAGYKYAASFGTNETEIDGLSTNAETYKSNATAVDNKAAFLTAVATASNHIDATLTTAFGTEKTGLAADITELKNQYNAYVAANGLDATATAFKDDIDALETALTAAAIADLDDPVDGIDYDDIKAATEALIQLQGDIADKETELLAANGSAANADVLADFNNQLDALAATASLEGYDSWVGDQTLGGKTLDEQITDLNQQITDLRAAIADEDNLSFYKDQYQAQIDAIETALTPVAAAITAKDAQFKANAAAYTTLSAQITELQGKIDTAKAKVGAYEYASTNYWYLIESYSYNYVTGAYDILSGGAQYMLNQASLTIETANASKSLTSTDVVANKANIEASIQDYLENSAYSELYYQATNLYTLLDAAIDVKYQAQTYSSALWNRLITEEAGINAEIVALLKEIYASNITYQGSFDNPWTSKRTSRYIHGSTYYYYYTLDDSGKQIAKDRTSDADYAAQMETVAAIKGEIETLSGAVDDLDLLGDANVDGLVNVLDYRKVANMILDPTLQPEVDTDLFINLDINETGVIEVGDLTAIVNYILNDTWNGHAAVKGDVAGESLSMSSTQLQANTKRIAVNLNNVDDYTAFQLDVVLPEGMTIVGTSLGERAGQSHEILSRKQLDGSVRMLVSSVAGETFSGNEGAVLYIDVETSNAFMGSDVELLNILFSDVDARTRSFSLGSDATGVDTVGTFEALKQKVYDLSGRVADGLRKGINIIRRADGSTQKVMK